MNFAAKKTTTSCTISWNRIIFLFQTDKVLNESLHMFDTQKNESMKNAIWYVAPKNKTMANIMNPNNMFSCVVGVSIFCFKTYWKQVFNFMDIKTTPTFKQFWQAKTLNDEENKSYYQRYDVKILRAFHKQAIIKQQMYGNILARRTGMGYSPGIHFQTGLINMDKSKALTMNNQPGKSTDKKKGCRCGSL